MHFDQPRELKPLKDIKKKSPILQMGMYSYARTHKKLKKINKNTHKNHTFPPRKMVFISTRTEPLDSAMFVSCFFSLKIWVWVAYINKGLFVSLSTIYVCILCVYVVRRIEGQKIGVASVSKLTLVKWVLTMVNYRHLASGGVRSSEAVVLLIFFYTASFCFIFILP